MSSALKYLQILHGQKKLASVYLVLPPCGAAENAMTLWSQQLIMDIQTWEKSSSTSVNQLGHPDLLILRPENGRTNYVVNNFDEYFREINFRPGDWQFRYIIIEAADRIPPIVANKLLMSLEFTPPWCIHFLLCDSKRPLLPTIESRAVNINLTSSEIFPTPKSGPPVTIKLPGDLQELLKNIQKNSENARRWEADLLQLIMHHPAFDTGDTSLHLCKILSRNVTSQAFNNPSYERIVPLWHLLQALDGPN